MNKILIYIFSFFILITRKVSTLKFLTNNRTRILVVSLHKIGDTVFTIPAIKYLYNLYKNNLTIICFPDSAKIYKTIFNELNIEVIEKDSFLFSRFALPAARKSIKKLKPKIIYDITGTITSVSLITGIRTGELFGITDPGFKEAFTRYFMKTKNPPLTDIYLKGVKQLGDHLKEPIYRGSDMIPVNNTSDNMVIYIHPFAGWKAKEWNLNKFISLAELLSIKYQCSIISGKGYIEDDIRNYLLQKKIDIIEPQNIGELIDEIKNCNIFIGNDSGPLYLASLLGKSTFTIYGPTNPEYSLPSGNLHSFINISLKCSPGKNQQYCFTNAGRKGCPAHECMNQLSVTEVYEKVINFIEVQKVINY